MFGNYVICADDWTRSPSYHTRRAIGLVEWPRVACRQIDLLRFAVGLMTRQMTEVGSDVKNLTWTCHPPKDDGSITW